MPLRGAVLSGRQNFGPTPPPPTPEAIAFDNSPAILAITGSFFAAAALVVLLRCYVRVYMLKVFGIDDWVMLFAMALCTVTFTCIKLGTDNGLGRHFMVILMLFPAKFARLMKLQYIQSIVIMVGISAVKVSIAFCLLRLSVQKWYTRILYGGTAFIVLMTTACAGTLILQCLPVRASWDMSLRPPPYGTGHAKCYSLTTFRNLGLMNSSFNIVTDVLFASLPIPLIWQLQLNIRTKVSLIVVLSLGWFACVAAIIKAVQQYHVLDDPDWTVWASYNVWNFVEFTIGIIAASLPTLKPLFNWFLETARALTTGHRSKGASYVNGTKGSAGYKNTTDAWDKNIPMERFTHIDNASSATSTSGKDPYSVKITGLAERDAWEATRKDSDESIYPLRPNQVPGSNGILRTKEISVV